MMRNCYITALAASFLFSAPLFAQEAVKREFSLKLTPLSYRFYFNDIDDPYRRKIALENRFEYPGLGLFITDKRKNGHDVELFNFYRNKEDVTIYAGTPSSFSYVLRSTSFQTGYSFFYFFLKKKDSPVKPFLGAGLELLYQKDKTEIPEHIHQTFPIHREYINTYTQLTPGIQYRPFKKFYLQFTIPVSWLVYGRYTLHIHNPTLTENQRHRSDAFRQVEAYIPARVGLRLSAGYVF